MAQTDSSSSLLLLERPNEQQQQVLVDLDVVLNSKRPKRESTGAPISHPSLDADPALRSPGLALIAAVALLEGYKRLDLMPAGTSRVSTLLFSHGGAVVFGVVAVAAAVLSTRTAGPSLRKVTRNLMIVGTLAVVAATTFLLTSGPGAASTVLGAADLVLASAATMALVFSEHRKRAGDHPEVAPARLPTVERASRAA